MLARYLLWVFLLCACAACKTLDVQNQNDRLLSALNTYAAHLRWGRAHEAYRYHIRRDGTQPPVDLERLENYSITSVTPLDMIVNPDATEATVPMEISYFNEQDGALRTIKETQVWWYSQEAKAWLTESGFPAVK